MSSHRGAENPSRTTFGKYQLIAALGSGGMADVYLAVAQGPARFNKLVVLKCLRKRWLEEEMAEDGPRADQGEFVEMFLEEARLAARLNHPNIVQTNEVGDESGDYFIAMEFLEGQSLNRIMNRAWRKDREIPLELALVVLCDALSGLHSAHELADYDGKPLEIVHRDASPHNIFVTYEGQTKLVDFGIAKATTRSFETRTGVLKGKIQYMAPEQARCTHVDRRADIFSIGVVLWELLAKKRMWAGVADIQILQKLVSEPVPRLADQGSDIPDGLVAIVDKATSSDAADRYATAEEMRLDIYNWAKVHLPQTSSKEMGQLTAELFADKRALVTQIIENQFAQIRRGQEISLNVMDPATTQTLPKAAIDASEGGETSDPSHSTSRRNEGLATLSAAATSNESFASGRPKRTGVWIGLGVLAVAGIAVAATVGGVGSSNPASTGTTSSPATSTSAATTAAATGSAQVSATATAAAVDEPEKANLTKLTVKVKPDSARIFVDDVAVTGNPYVGTFPKDAANHRLRAEADGFVTEKRLVSFDASSKEVELELAERAVGGTRPLPHYTAKTATPPPPPPPPTTAAVAPPPPPPAVDTTPKGPGKPPKRELDKTNPYGSAKP